MPKVTVARLTKRAVEQTPPGSYGWDGEVRGFGIRVTPNGSRSFVYRYTADGRQRYEPLGPFPALTVEQAREKAKALAGQRDVDHRGQRERAGEDRRRAKTLRELADHYLGDYARDRALRPSTLRDARGVLRLVPEAEMARPVAVFTKADIGALRACARDAAGIYQANRLLAVLSRMFKLAEEEGWRVANSSPAYGLRKDREDQRWRNLSEPEVARLLDACDTYVGQDPQRARNAADAVRLLLFTGARLQEVLKAEWAQFDLERGLWEKPSAHTKAKRQQWLELDGPPLELLLEMRKHDPDGRFLFPGTPLEIPGAVPKERPRADLKRPWAWLIREADLPGVRLHDLRRTTASFMLTGGATLATVGKTLGHTQAATTQRYAHLSQSVQRAELRRVGEKIAALRGTSQKAAGVPR